MNSDKTVNFCQRGMTLIGMLLVLILVAFVILLAFRVIPIYVEYFQVRKAIETVRKDISSLQVSRVEVERSLQRQFDIDYISAVQPRDLKMRKDRGRVFIDVVYEDRRPLVANLEIVGKFNEAIQVYP